MKPPECALLTMPSSPHLAAKPSAITHGALVWFSKPTRLIRHEWRVMGWSHPMWTHCKKPLQDNLGGTPAVCRQLDELGVPMGGAESFWACRFQHKAVAQANQACSAAQRSSWPFVARMFYVGTADAKSMYAAPLAIPHSKFVLQMTLLQAKIETEVLTGRPMSLLYSKLSGAAIRQLQRDMGWTLLWERAVASAISLYMTACHDHRGLAHTDASRHVDSAPGSWTGAVRDVMARNRIPHWHPNRADLATCTARKAALRIYRRDMVLPALANRHGDARKHLPLPWPWIAANSGKLFSKRCFHMWWQLRCMWDLQCVGLHAAGRCPLCSTPLLSTLRSHLANNCAEFMRL